MTELNSLKELNVTLIRSENRKADELRKIKITPNYIPQAAGSVLVEFGKTRVICAASVEEKIPRWMMNEKNKTGWITAEYSMTPYAGGKRKMRESTMGKIGGRTQEIQRLIGRSLRSVVTLKYLGLRTIWIDCDVIQADGGTRTASITGGYIALYLALQKFVDDGKIKRIPMKRKVSAISVGVVGDEILLDLDYPEDFAAAVDFNVVMTDTGEFIEVQGTAEERPFSRKQLDKMLKLAEKGCKELFKLQEEAVKI